MSKSTPGRASLTYDTELESFLVNSEPIYVAKTKTCAVITCPAGVQGIAAVSGWRNHFISNGKVLDNEIMLREVKDFAQRIEYEHRKDHEPCHAEMQLIAFYANYLEKYLAALEFCNSLLKNSRSASMRCLEIHVSRNVCGDCHRFARQTYLHKNIEVTFFVEGQADHPPCSVCSTCSVCSITMGLASRCRNCLASHLQDRGYTNIDSERIRLLQEYSSEYAEDCWQGRSLEENDCKDARQIRSKPKYAWKYFRRNHTAILARVEPGAHAALVQELRDIVSKSVKFGNEKSSKSKSKSGFDAANQQVVEQKIDDLANDMTTVRLESPEVLNPDSASIEESCHRKNVPSKMGLRE